MRLSYSAFMGVRFAPYWDHSCFQMHGFVVLNSEHL